MTRCAFAMFLLLSPCLRAEAPVPAAAPEITDQALEEMKARAKESLAKKTADIERTHADREAFAKSLKDDRVAFEKKLCDELVAFLTALKEIPLPERRKAVANFSEKQRADREEFNRQSRSKIEEFRRRNADAG